MIIEFGALAQPPSKQLKKLKNAEKADRAANNITFLHIHGFITDNEALKARNRLIKMWEKGQL